MNLYGAKLEKGNHKMCLTVDFGEVLYDYLMEWYEQYLITIEEVKAANSGEEKRKILTSYYNWEWNYPDGIDKEINKRIQRSRIKKVIEKLENELKELDGSEEENDS